jgi:hypothetical protein
LSKNSKLGIWSFVNMKTIGFFWIRSSKRIVESSSFSNISFNKQLIDISSYFFLIFIFLYSSLNSIFIFLLNSDFNFLFNFFDFCLPFYNIFIITLLVIIIAHIFNRIFNCRYIYITIILFNVRIY